MSGIVKLVQKIVLPRRTQAIEKALRLMYMFHNYLRLRCGLTRFELLGSFIFFGALPASKVPATSTAKKRETA